MPDKFIYATTVPSIRDLLILRSGDCKP